MTEPSSPHFSSELLTALVKGKVISAAQAEVAVSDQVVTGMGLDEILLARRWITAEVLNGFADLIERESPVKPSTDKDTEQLGGGQSLSSDYHENSKKYRQLIDRILGES